MLFNMAEGQQVDLDDVGGLAEIADELGITRQAVSNWAAGRCRPDFPPPLKRLRATPLYSISAVKDWYVPWKLDDRWDS